MTADSWDPAQYDRFRAERQQPFHDLLALVHSCPGGRAVDLGCGTGELTRVMHAEVGAAETVGIDNSPAMLAESRRHAGDGIRFEAGEIGSFAGGSYDLIFANASLHWVADHEALLARLAGALAPGGQLAFQVPANFDHPSHSVASEVASEPPFAGALRGRSDVVASVLAPEEYAVALDRLGFVDQHVRLQMYGHHLASTEDLVEWVKGTTLTPYRRLLPEPLYEEFLRTYRDRLIRRVGRSRPYFYPFKRILAWCRRA